MNTTELKELCKKADAKSQVVLKVADDRKIASIIAWVSDSGILVIEEK